MSSSRVLQALQHTVDGAHGRQWCSQVSSRKDPWRMFVVDMYWGVHAWTPLDPEISHPVLVVGNGNYFT